MTDLLAPCVSTRGSLVRACRVPARLGATFCYRDSSIRNQGQAPVRSWACNLHSTGGNRMHVKSGCLPSFCLLLDFLTYHRLKRLAATSAFLIGARAHNYPRNAKLKRYR